MDTSTLEKKLRTGPRTRDFQWYRRLHSLGRLYMDRVVISDEVFEHFRLAVKTTEEIYPGAWDIEFAVDNNSLQLERKVKIELKGIIVRFPEVTIRNSQRRSHNIKELFIRTRFRSYNNRLGIEGVYGTRTTLTFAEHNSRYLHSHLNRMRIEPANKYFYFGRFCTGSGSINIAIADLNSQGFSADRYISYLLNLDTLASWESLEGVPYIKIRDINSLAEGAREYNHNNSSNKTTFINALKRWTLQVSTYKPDINFKLEPNGVSLIEDEKYDAFLHSIPLHDTDKSYLLCFKSEEGTYFGYGQTPRPVAVPRFPNKYLFQGEEIEITITNTPEDVLTEIAYVFHPKTKSEIKKLLEYAANKAILRKTTVDRYKSTTSDIRENPQPDTIPVPADSQG
jgi:hypothetical protein